VTLLPRSAVLQYSHHHVVALVDTLFHTQIVPTPATIDDFRSQDPMAAIAPDTVSTTNGTGYGQYGAVLAYLRRKYEHLFQPTANSGG
jgi:hypothetical protein